MSKKLVSWTKAGRTTLATNVVINDVLYSLLVIAMLFMKPIETDKIFKPIIVVEHFLERISLEKFEQEVEEVIYLLLT